MLVAAGEILGRKYRVERVLGSGGMGIVVLATHLRLGQPVAIKVLKPEARGMSDVVLRFAREARTASRLKGEHAVRILDVDDSAAGDPFLVMEYLQGVDLQQHLAATGPLPIGDVTEYGLQACEGVAEAHAMGIIHRDLKPGNLFLTSREDGSPLIKILDFGISKTLGADGTEDFLLTKQATAVGSPSFMSPEQIKNSANVDARTDLWSLGVVLYQLLTGALPFEGSTTAELAAHIASDAPTPMRTRRPEVPEALEALVLRCLEKDAASRFADIAGLALALAPFAKEGLERALRVQRAFGERTPQPPAATLVNIVDNVALPSASNQHTASVPALIPGMLEKALVTEYGSTLAGASEEPTAKRRTRLLPFLVGAAAVIGIAAFAVTVAPSKRGATANSVDALPLQVPSGEARAAVALPSASVDAGIVAPKASASAAPRSSAGPVPPWKNPMDIDFR